MTLLFRPPVIAAIYLVLVNWSYMYSRPDTIAIPVLFELMAFVLFIVLSTPIYLLAILPLCLLSYRTSGYWWTGVLPGLLVAAVLTWAGSITDYNFSAYGTISMEQVTKLMVPAMFMAVYGQFLLVRHLQEREGATIVWSRRLLRDFCIGLLVVVLLMFGAARFYDRAPPPPALDLTAQDGYISGRILLRTTGQVIDQLLAKRGGLVASPGLLHHVASWEQGVAEQLDLFTMLIEGHNYPLDGGSGEVSFGRSSTLLSATEKIRIGANDADAASYRRALAGLADAEGELVVTPRARDRSRFAAYLEEVVGKLGQTATDLSDSRQRIHRALEPEKYSPTGAALLAMLPVWRNSNALYKALGSAWALDMLLEGAGREYTDELEAAGALEDYQNALAAIRDCQPESWPVGVADVAQMRALAEQMNRVEERATLALGLIYKVKAAM